ncbi:FAD assembly factor SdhE [Halocynthiibacter styelae]|uniref:FAD assembly factor SdhE n=1 Tax=Halocynthiibacter styelae TaxID=2761955 RepID=A0A8J7IHV4_9RHOB|nr:succinate dehydrogenase assembly factor 2 [Paenihalocynthiibacter styelae]MBI1492488.1 succinate dehydrogenase assembly factor 2 [Paenihalocynthiibacter styelae]
MTTETHEHRLKRLHMRSIRRGIKEMDIILSGFSDAALADLSAEELDLYEALLDENDHDLYGWVSGQLATPGQYLDLITKISTVHKAA